MHFGQFVIVIVSNNKDSEHKTVHTFTSTSFHLNS